MSKDKVKSKENNEKSFYEGIANTANFVDQRLDDSIAPGGLNNTVKEYVEDDKGKK